MLLLLALVLVGCAFNSDAADTAKGASEDSAACAEGAAEAALWFEDSDEDGFGDAARSVEACAAPGGYVADATDCDGANAAVHPNAVESCSTAADDDCDGSTNDVGALGCTDFYADADADGFGDATSTECSCSAPPGYVADDGDCDDALDTVSPAATELCNGLDDDCDGAIDPTSAADAAIWYADTDGDGFGDATAPASSCDEPSGYVADATDCDDTNDTLYADADADGVCDTAFADYTTDYGSLMVAISAGSYTMGGGLGDASGSFTDHVVTLTHDFWIGETEITRGAWESWSGGAGWSYVSISDGYPCTTSTTTADCPADTVSWYNAARYANALSTAEGLANCYLADGTDMAAAYVADPYSCPGYRLPTEAEWEYAARADVDTTYAGSNTAADVAWTYENAHSMGTYAHEACTLSTNAWGLCDMSGNLYEWTNDWYDAAYGGYASGVATTNPPGPSSGSKRVIRGGYWWYYATAVAVRGTALQSGASYGSGFRLARSSP